MLMSINTNTARLQLAQMFQRAQAALTHPVTDGGLPEDKVKYETEAIAEWLVDHMKEQGIAHQDATSKWQKIKWREVGIIQQDDGRVWAYFVVDTTKLPRGINIDKLTSDAILRQLSAACRQQFGRDLVLADPKFGPATFLTWFHEVGPAQHSEPLPKKIGLDMSSYPVESEGEWHMPLGMTAQGPHWFATGGQGHILVVGQTGSGKSTWMKTALAALISRHSTASLKLAIIDPKRVEFAAWRRIQHLIAPVATEIEEASAVLEAVAHEMNERATLLAEKLFTDFRKYNASARKSGQPILPLLVVVFDEFVDLIEQSKMEKGRSKLESLLIQIATKGRAAGVVLMLGTAEAKAEVVNTTLRRNCAYRVCFRVGDAAESRIVLDQTGAESIRGVGRLLARIEGTVVEAQGYTLDDDRLAMVIASASSPIPSHPEEDTEALDEVTVRLIHYSLDHMDGEFAVNRLFEGVNAGLAADNENYIVKNQIELIARILEGQGLLQVAPKANDPKRRKVRMVTEGLKNIVRQQISE